MDQEIAWVRSDIARAQEAMTKGVIAFSVLIVVLMITATVARHELYGFAGGFCVTLGGFAGWQNRLILRGGEYIRKAQAQERGVGYKTWEEHLASLRGKDPIGWFIAATFFGPGMVFVTCVILIWKMTLYTR